MAGPAVLLGYGVAGIIAFLIMRQLGEMVVEEPVSGSFAHFAFKYWGPFAGFLSGWNYWAMFVLVGMAELTAAGIYMQYWFPDVPTWIWAAAFSSLLMRSTWLTCVCMAKPSSGLPLSKCWRSLA
jgi:phenylalanine-specific permease